MATPGSFANAWPTFSLSVSSNKPCFGYQNKFASTNLLVVGRKALAVAAPWSVKFYQRILAAVQHNSVEISLLN
jgi:hypothetical protein